ncbi:MAG: hypothetical protein WB697_24200 [Stellaceae bacterium]
MKFIMLPLLFSLAGIGYINRDRIADEYNAAYPSDPAKEAALRECISENAGFNRLDTDDRTYCYRHYLWAVPGVARISGTSSPPYAKSPSHLAGDDIRRQEATDSFRHHGLEPTGTRGATLSAPSRAAGLHMAANYRQLAVQNAVASWQNHQATSAGLLTSPGSPPRP